jgi:hypothetical protein
MADQPGRTRQSKSLQNDRTQHPSLLGRRRIVFALVDAWWTLRGAP